MSKAKNAAAAGAVGVLAFGASEVVTTTEMYKKIPEEIAKAMPGKTPTEIADAVLTRQRVYRGIGAAVGGILGVTVVAMFTGGDGVKKAT
jgi:hypothetical protein